MQVGSVTLVERDSLFVILPDWSKEVHNTGSLLAVIL